MRMRLALNYEGIEKYWKDDYYFCEDKILANVSSYYGCQYELMFAGAFNFGYQPKSAPHQRVGDRISVKYFHQRELLEKYSGIMVKKYDSTYGAKAFLEQARTELRKGKPVAVGLENCGVWQVKAGEEEVRLLPFLIVGMEEDSVEVIDSHELGVRRTLTRQVFMESYRWGVTFDKKEVSEEIDVKEFIGDILQVYENTVVAKHGCVDIDLSFSSISSNPDRFKLRKTENPYQEMLMLAEDIVTMDFDREVCELGGVLWVPFYFGMLLLYRSRLVFTKALSQVAKKAHTDVFSNIIKRLIVASSKWNYLRMVFTNCYHNKKLDEATKRNMSLVVRDIAEQEKMVIEEFRTLYKTYDKDVDKYKAVELGEYFNTYIFANGNWRSIDESKMVYGRYYYDGKAALEKENIGDRMEFCLGKPTKKGDSLVCVGQSITLGQEVKGKKYHKIALCGSVLYNEMIYDYMNILYSDGSRQSIWIGFDGWIKNEYSLEEYGEILWQGTVRKREHDELSDIRRRAVIYGKEYSLQTEKEIVEIRLPNNPFINILAISLK